MKIAIDGPAASGKSTTAKLLADKLDFIYIDTGAMYRACTLLWLEKTKAKKSDQDQKILDEILDEIDIKFFDNGKKILVNDVDKSERIRSSQVSQNVSYIASFANVREAMVQKQRELAKGNNVIMDGRDIGTVVFPDAELKFFLHASSQTRAQRRLEDLKGIGENPDLAKLILEIEERDKLDSDREIAPLKKSNDAIEITTDTMSVDEVVSLILEKIKSITSLS